jgi:hypothetical protein
MFQALNPSTTDAGRVTADPAAQATRPTRTTLRRLTRPVRDGWTACCGAGTSCQIWVGPPGPGTVPTSLRPGAAWAPSVVFTRSSLSDPHGQRRDKPPPQRNPISGMGFGLSYNGGTEDDRPRR